MSVLAEESTIAIAEEELQEFEPTTVPGHRRLGRYELVYELGTGGMANVYLARAAGPAGFRKWFAIKRIHPHLAKDRRFVEMFLDEARIHASIQHPNVAQVFELGDENGEYYIAMEYLHGEHLGALAVRAAREMGRVPAELAAYAIARTADGLHHAHEAKGPAGQPLDLVHRDVSPQNIFVTYDGTVRMTDFGVAKAANRITQTETGGTKGKLAYMSPEHATGGDIDRRSDVFALGVVLWELTVGRRLFKGSSDGATLMRITSGRAIPPSSVVSDYPLELEKIVMRALARDRANRYGSAASMARDLDRFVAGAGTPSGAAELSGLMRRLFGDRIAQKEQLLRADPDTHIDAGFPKSAGDVSDSAVMPHEQSHSSVVVRARPRAVDSADGRAKIVVGVLAAVALVAGAVGGIAVLSDDRASVRVSSDPSGARAYVDGEYVGSTPLTIDDLSPARHVIDLELEGYASFEATFDAETGRNELSYRLRSADDVPEPEVPRVASATSPPTVEQPVDDPPIAERHDPIEPSPVETEDDPATSEDEPAAMPAPVGRPRRPNRDPSAQQPAAEPAYLNLVTVPWAQVRINDRSYGRTPLVRRSVPAGTLRVQLRPEGRGPWQTVRVSAAPGEVVSRRLEL